MVEPISTGAALVAVGGWFANKLLGPSAESLGEQLKAFSSDRWRKISGRAEQLAERMEITPLPPGFAYIAMQKASFSEDDKAITEMWANLLLDASIEYRNEHLLYADILSQLSPKSAEVISEMVPETYSPISIVAGVDFEKSGFQDKTKYIFESWRQGKSLDFVNDVHSAAVAASYIMQMKPHPLVNFIHVTVPYFDDKNDNRMTSISIRSETTFDQEILLRQNLLSFQTFDLIGYAAQLNIGALVVTNLGFRFLKSCRGKKS